MRNKKINLHHRLSHGMATHSSPIRKLQDQMIERAIAEIEKSLLEEEQDE